MTLNKFEKKIREKLQSREIMPSDDAWDKVSASLDVSSKPKGSNYFRYAIAAGFTGILLISVLYFREKDIPAGELEKGGYEETAPPISERDQMVLPEKEQDATVTDSGDLPLSGGHIPKPPTRELLNLQGANASRVAATSGVAVETEKAAERLIEAKLEEVVADIHQMEQGRQALTDLEVDSLLRQAQEELLANQSGVGASVSAKGLLMEVEDELDESFREKLFTKLQESFQKVRTAVADRNN